LKSSMKPPMVYSRRIGSQIIKTVLIRLPDEFFKEVDIIEFDAHIEDSSTHEDVKLMPHAVQVGSPRKIAA